MKCMLIILAVLITLGCGEDEEFISQAEKICAGVEVEEPNWGDWKNDMCVRFAKGLLTRNLDDLRPCELGTMAHFCRRLEGGATQLFDQQGVEVYHDRYSPHEVTKYVIYPGEEHRHVRAVVVDLRPGEGTIYKYHAWSGDLQVQSRTFEKGPRFVHFESDVRVLDLVVEMIDGNAWIKVAFPNADVTIVVDDFEKYNGCAQVLKSGDQGVEIVLHTEPCGTVNARQLKTMGEIVVGGF